MPPSHSTAVPQAMQPIYREVTGLTDAFCRDWLNDEYAELARAMAAALARKRPSPLASGQVRTWACSILYTLGQLNFLPDKSFQPSMSMAELCSRFGVGQSTAMAKAKVIRTVLKVNRLDTNWMLSELAARHPRALLERLAGLVLVQHVRAAG